MGIQICGSVLNWLDGGKWLVISNRTGVGLHVSTDRIDGRYAQLGGENRIVYYVVS